MTDETALPPTIDRSTNSLGPGPQIDRPTDSSRGTQRLRRVAARVGTAGLALGLGVAGVLVEPRDSGAREAPRPVARRVAVAEVRAAPAHRTATFTSVVQARQRARLGFTLGGRMLRRPVEVGQRVAAGAVLAELDRAPLLHARDAAQAQVQDAEARLAQLERDVARAQRLVSQKAGLPEALEKTTAARDATAAALEAGRAQLREAERRLTEGRLLAPFGGTVLEVALEPGELANPGAPVVVLSAEQALEVEVQVPEAVRAGLAPDAEVQVTLPMAGGVVLPARIRSIGDAAAGPAELFPVVVALDVREPRAAPGYTAEVALPVRRAPALELPVGAVADPGGQAPFVYTVADGVAQRVPVRVHGLAGSEVLVSAVSTQDDLRVGDLVVVRGHASLLPGEAVEVAR
jgi:RND family efflux transporter MFP subunit